MKMGFDGGRGKQLFAGHPDVHQNYIRSGRVKYLQQFCIIASFATDCDAGSELEAANRWCGEWLHNRQ